MAKRYHDKKMGEGHHMKQKMSQGDYAGEYARRTQEMEDAGMIHSDFRAIANMPQEVMMKPYPKGRDYMPEGLDDTIKGVDHQMDTLDDGKRDKNLFPKKV